MKVKIALSPLEEYVYPIMNWKGIKITEHVSYGGEDSESYPCGFISTLVYEKIITKRQKKNANYRKKPKALTPTGDNRSFAARIATAS